MHPVAGEQSQADRQAVRRGTGHDHALEDGALEQVPLELVDPNPQQPRRLMDPAELADLSASIASLGVLQPVLLVRAQGRFVIVAGERRVQASRLAGRHSIPAIVLPEGPQDDFMALAALVENLQRADLSPVDVALAYRHLSAPGRTSAQVGEMVGKSADHVRAHLALLALPEGVRRMLDAGVLSLGHARVLCAVQDPGVAQELADQAVRLSLTVRQVAERVSSLGEGLSKKSKSRRQASRRGLGQCSDDRFADATQSLQDALDTSVRVEGSSKGGWIHVRFADTMDLARIQACIRSGAGQPVSPCE